MTKQTNFQNVLEELGELYSIPLDDAKRLFEETAAEFLTQVFKYEADFVLSDDPKFYLFKPNEVVVEPATNLNKGIVKGMIAYVKRELRKRFELELLWKTYVKARRKIKTVVKGKIFAKSGRDYYVNFTLDDEENPLKPLELVGICLYEDTTYSDRKNFALGVEKLFMIKNCYTESLENTLRLVVLLTRQSKTFVKKLFVMHGVPENEILRIERKPFKVLVYAKRKLPKEVIREVSREIDEGVIVRYGS